MSTTGYAYASDKTLPIANFFNQVDLQAYCRGFRYVREMLKMLPEPPEPILLSQIFAKLTSVGCIHNASTAV